MTYSRILLATAAIGAMAAASVPAEALAKQAKASGSSSAAEIKALRAELEALKARLDAQEAANTQAQAAAQETAAQAAAAQAAATAAQASADDVKKTADKAAKDTGTLSKLVDGVKDTKISGRMYFNISQETEKARNAKTVNGGGFQIKRFYVGIDHRFSPIFSGNVTMDIDNVVGNSGICGSGTGSTPCNVVGKGFYVKKAYLQAKFAPELMVRLGAADTPWVPYVEGVYGYRHLEKVITDLNGFGTSADWGVHVLGDLAGGLISYQVSAVDGAGYRNPQFSKTIDFEGRVSLNYKGINAAIGGYTGKLGKNTQSNQLANIRFRTASRFDALLVYKGKLSDIDFSVGGEYFTAKNYSTSANNFRTATSFTPTGTSNVSDKAEGYSLFASVAPIKQWSVFGRYDSIKPSKDTRPTRKGQYFNAGIQYSPAKIVDLALMYKHYKGDNGYALGDLRTPSFNNVNTISARDEFGLFGQFRW